MDFGNGDIVMLDTGEHVLVTDCADAPETLFVYTLNLTDRDSFSGVTDRCFVTAVVTESYRKVA